MDNLNSYKNNANKELETAIRLYKQLPTKAEQDELQQVLIHLFRAVELWVDEKFIHNFPMENQNLSLNSKIRFLKKNHIITDEVLEKELAQLNNLRNITMHAKELTLSFSELYKYIQIAMHFVKVGSPSAYITPEMKPRYRTLSMDRVRSKSEVIIANVLTYLKIPFEYEKRLYSKTNPKDFIIPDFTINYNGKQYYWEHFSVFGKEYRKLMRKKKKWYQNNGYEDRLVTTTESKKRPLDSQKILRKAKRKILEADSTNKS